MKVEIISYKKNNWTDSFPENLDSENTLILVFGAPHFFDKVHPFQELVSNFPKSTFMGCSSGGEILGATVNDESLVVAIIRFEKTRLKFSTASVFDTKQSFSAGEKIAQDLEADDLQGVIVLSDGLNVSGTQLVTGLNSVFSSSVSVTGGLAADGNRFERTWVLENGLPKEKIVSAVGLYGNSLKIGQGSRDGLDIFGIERRITKSHENQLFELDGKPALDLYKNYLGQYASDLPGSALRFPLSIRSDLNDEKRIVRSVLNVDEENQSVIFAGDIPEGSLAQLMRANLDRVIDGAVEAAIMAKRNGETEGDILSLVISCIGRRWVLGERTEDEIEGAIDSLREGTMQVGFYSYGEISPYTIGYCDLHNQTMTLMTFFEE